MKNGDILNAVKCDTCGKEHITISKPCSHEDATLVKAIANTHFCVKCSKNLVSNEIYINYEYVEVGAFCDDDKCERYMLLVA